MGSARVKTFASVNTKKPAVAMKRVSFNLPEPLFVDIQQFAQDRGDTMTGVLRWSLGLGKAVWDEIRAGNRIQVVDEDQEVLKELVISAY